MPALPDYPVALQQALAAVRPLASTKRVRLDDATGRVLREPVIADRDLPPFDRAQMDGYALRAAEVGSAERWPVARVVAAGQPAPVRVPPGQCVRIATGAPVPEDLDTVIEHEMSDRKDPVRFTIDTVKLGRGVHPRGADARRGDALVDTGTVLQPHHLGIAAAVGRTALDVAVRPRAIVLTSGDEVMDAGADVAPHQIRNSNGPQTIALLARFGAGPIEHRHLRDEVDETDAAVADALAAHDLVVTIGGVSAGERDHFPGAFDAAGVERVVEQAAIQPGKPILVGRAPTGAMVVALPGNPVSSLVCACLFAWPIVRALGGANAALPWCRIRLGADVRPNARRRAFRPAILEEGRARVPAWAGSGDLAHTAATHGVVELPVQEETVTAGTEVRYLAWP